MTEWFGKKWRVEIVSWWEVQVQVADADIKT